MQQEADPAPAHVLDWVSARVRPGARPAVRSLSQARRGGPWLLEYDVDAARPRLVLHVGDPGQTLAVQGYATAVAALELAARHSLPVPEVVASDLSGRACGRLALVSTALAGTSRIPVRPQPSRLRALGRAAALIHAVDAAPSPQLPPRTRPLAGVEFGEQAAEPTRRLLAAGRAALASVPSPPGPSGFVHGDLWHGNTLWDGDALTGVLDWDFAGVGPAGVDLGSLRCDAAVLFGVEAAADILAGWEEARGRHAEAMPYWDVVAACSSPPDMSDWLPTFHAQGRADLDLASVVARRDRYLAEALAALG